MTSEYTQTVRMILVEYIQGITMADAKPRICSQSARQHIMKSVVDIENLIFAKDILLTDLEPRNIIINLLASDQRRVVFIDLGHALFNRRQDDPSALQLDNFLGKYISPVLRWNDVKGKIHHFSKWIDWDWDSWLKAEFAHTIADITPEMRERWSDE